MPGKRILLVDYDPRSLSHTREVLEKAGFTVSTCGDGLSALDHFKNLSPDLVLLSAMLPKMHGFEVCSNIRKLPNGNDTPVVIITDVYKGKRYRVDAINKYGATEYIEKPIEDANLVNILRGLVKGNGSQTEASPIEVADERTVQFSMDLLTQMVKEVPIGGSNAPAENKTVTDKPKVKDDISKKLEDSLAGLSLEVNKKTAKSRPAATPASASSKSEDSGPMLTSEDLFTDIIASVERELQSEKILSESRVQEPPPPTIQVQSPPVQPARKPVQSKPATEQAKKSSGFDLELEKKLSSTLSGLRKETAKTASTAAKAPTAAKRAAPAGPKMDSKPGVSVPPKLDSKPGVTLPPPKIESKPGLVMPPAPASVKGVTHEGINFGQYLLLSKIATGGMAELFKAKRKGVEGFEKILAVKRILPHMSDNEEFVTMFIDEAKLAAQLTHHNICQIFDLGKIENSYYIAMEYVHGKDLRAVLKAARGKNRSIPVELAILIVSKVASALDYAHRKRGANGQPINLVHRDVSPQNILLSYEGEVKLVDFGIAKAATKMHTTQHGALKGKLLYMSPEQAWGRAVDKRSDLFSLGVVLFELLTGRPLFFEDNDTEMTILDKVREARIPPLREFNSRVSADLEKIVSKALKRNPDERYQTAFDFQKDLDNLFYTEGYNATGATLSDFIRSLFPEESGQESGETKATLAALPVERPAAPAVAAGAPEPVVEKKPEKRPAPAIEEKRMEPPAAAVSSAPKAAKQFRDISSPEIMPPQKQSSFPVIPVSIAAVIIAAVLGLFLMFRGGSEKPAVPQTAQASTQSVTPPSVEQKPAEQAPAVGKTDASEPQQQIASAKSDEEKKKEEEARLAEQQKLEDQKKLEEERKKQEEAKLEEARKKAAEELAKEEPPIPAPEPTKVAELQPPAAQVQNPVQEPPKQQVPSQEAPKPAVRNPEPAVSSVKEGDLVELTPDVVKPELLNRVNPVYPPVARQKKIEGTVILSILVSEDGAVSDVKVLRAAGGSAGLNESATNAVKKWKFRPAVKDGKRVKVWVTYPIVFKLS